MDVGAILNPTVLIYQEIACCPDRTSSSVAEWCIIVRGDLFFASMNLFEWLAMSVIELPVQVRLVDLLAVIERLPPAEIDAIAARVEALQRMQRAQIDLQTQRQRRLSPTKARRLEALAAKSEAETIEAAERAELLALSAEAEQLDAEWAEALLHLAQERNIPFAQLWAELNPDAR